MKISELEKLEILSRYNISEQKGLAGTGQNTTQTPNQSKSVYKRIPEVKEIQTKLKQLSSEIGNPNLDPGNIDGIFGDRTLRAFNALVDIHNSIVQ